jgi:hypothetical protein
MHINSNIKILIIDYGSVQKAYVLEFIQLVWKGCIEDIMSSES